MLLRLKLKWRVWEQEIRMMLKASSRFIFSEGRMALFSKKRKKFSPYLCASGYSVTRILDPG